MSTDSKRRKVESKAEEAFTEDVTRRSTTASQTLFRYREPVTHNLVLETDIQRVFYADKSEYQQVDIFDSIQFGKVLVLDRKIQSAQLDEFIYHEHLVQPAMFAHPNPKRVFIGGGGEMATAREVLKHKSVEQLIMVDLDEEVVKMCIKHLPEWDSGASSDPRIQLEYGDAKAYLENYSGPPFDVIIQDICDPIEGGPGVQLYMREFYETIATKLAPGGIMVTQSGPCGLVNFFECFTAINKTMSTVFDSVYGYSCEVPSFGSEWGFNLAYNRHDSLPADMTLISRTELDKQIGARLRDDTSLRCYDGNTHLRAFNLPRHVRNAVASETRVITKDNPVYYLEGA